MIRPDPAEPARRIEIEIEDLDTHPDTLGMWMIALCVFASVYFTGHIVYAALRAPVHVEQASAAEDRPASP